MIDLQLLKNIMEEVRENKDLLDSFSPNQFKSKLKLINHIKNLNILNKDSEIALYELIVTSCIHCMIDSK